jgi:uncharacterized protein YndB with AHSA1/START domain
MEVDVMRAFGAVTREVARREVDGKMARVIVAARGYDTDVEDLWDALTNAERLPRWFLPVSGEFKLGGRYQIKGNASGTVTQCDPPRVLGLTWEHGGAVSWVTVTLQAKGKGSHLELEHVAHVPEEFWSQFGPGAVGGGWDLALMGLGEHVEKGLTNDPQEAEAWTTSTPEGRDFVRRCSDDWARAAIADGEDEAVAKAGADATFAFYTGG